MMGLVDTPRTERQSYADMCAKCHVCEFMPKQEKALCLEEEGTTPPILFIDDMYKTPDMSIVIASPKDYLVHITEDVFGINRQHFTYTNSVRCMPGLDVTDEQMEDATQRCSVWTHFLADNRLVIVSTVTGLSQLEIDATPKPGDLFRSLRLGIILCIPPILTMDRELSDLYAAKFNRALKQAGLKKTKREVSFA